MQKKVFVDTSCLIILDKIDSLDILNKVYGIVFTTNCVALEFGKNLPHYIVVEGIDTYNYNKLEDSDLESGEKSILSKALNNNSVFIILDDLKARRFAKINKIKFTGTIGVLIEAKEKNTLDH